MCNDCAVTKEIEDLVNVIDVYIVQLSYYLKNNSFNVLIFFHGT